MPILHHDTVYKSLSTIHSSPEAYSLVTALCGLVVVQPRMDSESNPVASQEEKYEWPSVEYLIQEAVQGRARRDHIESPTLWTVITSFFLFACYFGLDRHNAAWFYLRESITFAQLIGLPDEESYANLDEREATFRRRMFWLLFITERAYALQRHRPLSLQKSIGPPGVPEGEESLVLQGFLDLVNLFQHFDASFVSLWNHSSTALSDTLWVPRLQENLARALPDIGNRTEIQQADLLISREWLKVVVWQLCLNKGLLSSKGQDECTSFRFPISVARSMMAIGQQLPVNAMEPHGVGILEKVFDIGCSLADIMKVLPAKSPSFEIGPPDYLVEMLRMLSTIRGGKSRYLPLLAAQVDEVLKIGCGNPIAEISFIPRSNPGAILGEADSDESGYDSQYSLSSTATAYTGSPPTSVHSMPYSPADIGSPYPVEVEPWQDNFALEARDEWQCVGVHTVASPPPFKFIMGRWGIQGEAAESMSTEPPPVGWDSSEW
ncbi:MAG: hypothetical protein M1840_008583 [Geoglossum simile]|nr:MAG: hypothetical protein M1840_008583 [Geoglossum simile]